MIELGWTQVGLSALPLLGIALLFRLLRLDLDQTLLIGAVRTWLQLTCVGFILKGIFTHARWEWTFLFACVMIATGVFEVVRRQKHRLRRGKSILLAVFGLSCAGVLTACYALVVLVGADPWWTPQYSIPLMGMILGNTMTGIALGMDTFLAGLVKNRALLETRLALGTPMALLMREQLRESMRTSMLPIINSLAICGIVSLPGMMTGQILAGNDPATAVRYQMMIMYMIATGAACGSLTTLIFLARTLTDARERLRLDRIIGCS